MFNVSEETKAAAIEAMREVLLDAELTDEKLSEAFDRAVAIVKKSFGF